MSVSIALTGNGKHEIEIKAFNAKADIKSKQINLSGKPEKIQLALTVADQNKPYIAVISVDKNPQLQKEIMGAYVSTSISVKK